MARNQNKKRKRQKSKPATPVRAILKADSFLRTSVRDGLDAVEGAHRQYIDADIRAEFADSMDLDAAMRPGREGENRWDYLLGHSPANEVIALEPHSASEGEIGVLIAKKIAALDQLRGELRPGAYVSRWIWVASGKVQFLDMEKARFRLSKHGIEFAGGRIIRRHVS